MEILDRRQIPGTYMIEGCVNLTWYLQNAQRTGNSQPGTTGKVLDGSSIMNIKGFKNTRLELYLVIISASEKLEHTQRFMYRVSFSTATVIKEKIEIKQMIKKMQS